MIRVSEKCLENQTPLFFTSREFDFWLNYINNYNEYKQLTQAEFVLTVASLTVPLFLWISSTDKTLLPILIWIATLTICKASLFGVWKDLYFFDL